MQTTLAARHLVIPVVYILVVCFCQELSGQDSPHVKVASQCIDEDMYHCAYHGWYCVNTYIYPACTGLTKCPDSQAKMCAMLGKQCVMEVGRPRCRSILSIDDLTPVPSECPDKSEDSCAHLGGRCVQKGDKPTCVQPHEVPTPFEYISTCREKDIKKCASENKVCIIPDARRQCAVVSQCPQELERKCAMAQKHCILINDVPLCERDVRISTTPIWTRKTTMTTYGPRKTTMTTSGPTGGPTPPDSCTVPVCEEACKKARPDATLVKATCIGKNTCNCHFEKVIHKIIRYTCGENGTTKKA